MSSGGCSSCKLPVSVRTVRTRSKHRHPASETVSFTDCIFFYEIFCNDFFPAFFLNPISHEPGYRLHVIHSLPSVQFLDRKGEIYRFKHTIWTTKPLTCRISLLLPLYCIISIYLLCCQKWSQQRGRAPSRSIIKIIIASSSLWPSADVKHDPQTETNVGFSSVFFQESEFNLKNCSAFPQSALPQDY